MYPFITLSGPDLVGKQTQTELLAKALGAELFSFPNYNRLAGQLVRAALTNSDLTLTRKLTKGFQLLEEVTIKDYFSKKENPAVFQLFHMIDRLEAQMAILETLKTKPIVADRYDIDALVYGSVDGVDIAWVRELISILRPSDLVIILKGPNFVRKNEFQDANESDKEFLEKIKLSYDSFIVSEGWETVETAMAISKEESIDLTHKNILNLVYAKFPELLCSH